MTVHLLKMCVGVDSVAELRALQAGRLERLSAAGDAPELHHRTRNFPRRAAEIEGRGSLYWIIKGFVRVRQGIVALERVDDEALKRCAIVLDPVLVETVPRRCRPMQGWRYLEAVEAADAPADRPCGRAGDEIGGMPPEMVAELRALGLL
jgi:hypothetical protein